MFGMPRTGDAHCCDGTPLRRAAAALERSVARRLAPARARALCCALLAMALALPAVAARAQSGAYDWSQATEISPGVLFAKVSVTVPRRLDVHCLRVDGTNPWVEFATTGRAPDWVPGVTETIRKTTRNFVRETRAAGRSVVAAINGDAFQPWPAPFAQESPTDLLGLAVADGVVVSPPSDEPSFVVFDDGSMTITPGLADLAGVAVAVSGFAFVLDDGVVLPGGTDLQPRTGIGLSADGRYAYLLVIDGRRHASQGATTAEVGAWLAYFGAHDGLNLDGGGSSTMVRHDPAAAGDGIVLLNNPVGNGLNWLLFDESVELASYVPSERANGNNLGVVRAADRDGDLLPERAEAAFGTDPDNPDSDGDGIGDGDEVAAGSDPTAAPGCPATPREDCLPPAEPRAATLQLFDSAKPGRDTLVWRYLRGAATPAAALGDPTTSTPYLTCMFDSSARPQPIVAALVPAGNTWGCPPGDCWRQTASGGFVYRNRSRRRTHGGVRTVRLVPGNAGRSAITVKGVGSWFAAAGAPGAPSLPLMLPVRVQTMHAGGACWESRFSAARTNTARELRARAD